MLYSIALVITCKISNNFLPNDIIIDCIADSKDQQSIQLNITSDKGHHGKVKKIHTMKHHLQESRELNPYQAGDHTAVRNIKTVKQR